MRATANNARTTEMTRTNGPAAAALIAAMIGLLTLSTANLLQEAISGLDKVYVNLGSLWMPNASGIGPYSGKETLWLAAWGISWLIAHRMLSKRSVSLRAPLIITVMGLIIATGLLWPPFMHAILGK